MKLTDQELRKLRDAYNVQKKTQRRRKPDRNGHRIQVTMTFEEWLQVWTESGKLVESQPKLSQFRSFTR